MHKILHLCWLLLMTGCTQPKDTYTPPTGTVRYHPQDWSKAVELSDSFSAEISELLSKRGEKWEGTGGWATRARGVIAIGDSQYSYYGGFITYDEMKWDSEIFRGFWEHLNDNGEDSAADYNPEA